MASAPMPLAVSTLLRAAAVALSLSFVAAMAQQPVAPPPGQPAGELPRWSQWLQGEPLELGGQGAPAATVVVDHAAAPNRAAFAGDGDCFADLARRFGPRGLVVVALVAAAPASGLEHWAGCRVAVDPEAAAARHWRLGDGRGSVVVLDARGELVFHGTPDGGVVDAVEAVLAANGAPLAPRQVASLRSEILASFDDLSANNAAQLLGRVLAMAPHDGPMRALRYLAAAHKQNDREAAGRELRESLEVLAGEVRPLAAFADLVLRGDPRGPGVAAMLRAPLQAAAAAAPHDPVVQLAWLRALRAAGDGRELMRQALRARKVVAAAPEHCLDLVSVLVQDADPAVHRDLCSIVLKRAEELGAEARQLVALRYAVRLRCEADPAAAKELLDAYTRDTELRSTLNNDCWYFLTELRTMGRCDVFAAALAERMIEQRETLEAFEFDTAALAMFTVGRTAEAVSLQQSAIEKAGAGSPEYAERLDRYKAALAAAPR